MKHFLLVAICVCLLPAIAEAESLKGSRPNIVLIMPDDKCLDVTAIS